MQVAVDVDGPGRYLPQRYVRQHQRRSGGAQRGPARLVEAGSTQPRDVAVVIAEDQEPLARALGHVEHQAIVPPGIRMADVAEADDGVVGAALRLGPQTDDHIGTAARAPGESGPGG